MRVIRPSTLLLLVFAHTLAGQEWPQFRGPTGQGLADAHDVPLHWSDDENVRWKVPVDGRGWSSPVVGGGKVWVTSSVDAPESTPNRRGISLRAIAFDAATGKRVVDTEVFRVTRPRELNPKNSFASPTPILDGDRVYVHYGADGTAALTSSGEVVWRAQLPYASQHGGGGSPALYRDLLIINCDGNASEAFVVALDKGTGKERWRRDRRRPADQAYTTPLVINAAGRDQLISVGAYRATSYDPLTGREIWRVGYDDGFSNVPRPVFGNGLVFIATGFQQPRLIAVRPDGGGDVTSTHVAWTLTRGAPYTPSPVLVDNDLYVVSDNGILTQVDSRTGAVRYQQRLGAGSYSASPVFADGRLYFLSEEGVTTVISPGPAFTRLAVNRVDGATLASMAVVDGAVFLRTDRFLYRIGE